MDLLKIGNFLAALRKEKKLTQRELGEQLGVTDKTVSRWENGNYLPPVDILQKLALMYGVSINELLSGERLTDESFRLKADENIILTAKQSAFTVKEREKYFKRKWRKENIWLFVIAFAVFAAVIVLPIVFDEPFYIVLAPTVALIEYAYLNNRMMAYVERHIYND